MDLSGIWPGKQRSCVRLATAIFAICALIGHPAGKTAFAGTLPEYDRVRALDPSVFLHDVELVDSSGREFTLDQLREKVAFVFFGFTNCPDVCPLTMQRFMQLRDTGNLDLDRVVFVLISVDGERDTPEVMQSFLSAYGANFVGLTGETSEVKKLAKQFRAPFFKGHDAGNESGGYSVAHSPQSFIVDTDGALRAEFYNASIEAMAGIATALIAESDADDSSEPAAGD